MIQHLVEEVELTSQDIVKLQASIRNTGLFVLMVAAVGIAGVYFFSEGVGPVFVLLTFMGFLLYIASKSISGMKEILSRNKKMIIKGFISNERWERVGSGKSSRRNYYKTIGDHELQVDARVNRRYKVGDVVEIHYALNGKMVPFVFTDKLLSAEATT